MMTTYHCDCCGLECSRIHHGVAYGGDVSACDRCCGYDWTAYDEPIDMTLLHARADQAWQRVDKSRMTVHQRADLWCDLLWEMRHA